MPVGSCCSTVFLGTTVAQLAPSDPIVIQHLSTILGSYCSNGVLGTIVAKLAPSDPTVAQQ
jgi:hypothetical protein